MANLSNNFIKPSQKKKDHTEQECLEKREQKKGIYGSHF